MRTPLDGQGVAVPVGAMRNSPPRQGPQATRPPTPIEPLAPYARQRLERFSKALSAAQGILGWNAPARLILTLIDVAAHPETTRTEAAQRIDAPLNTVTQDLRTLSTELRSGEPGLRFIAARWDAVDYRLLRYSVTARGGAALASISAAIDPACY